MPGTDTGPSARQDLHVEIDEAAQSARIFVINIKVIDAKVTFFRFFVSHSFIILLERDIFYADFFVIHRLLGNLDDWFAGGAIVCTAAQSSAAFSI